MQYIIPTVVGVLALALGMLLGVVMRKKIAESKIGSAEEEASRIRLEAKRDAETLKKEAIVSANEEALRIKTETEKECKERRTEVQRQERRIQQKEDNLDRKSDNLDKKDELLNKKIKENEQKAEKLDALRVEQEEMLQTISQMSVEEARESLLKRVEDEARHDMAVKLLEIENELKGLK
jgi:ribonuclease Y